MRLLNSQCGDAIRVAVKTLDCFVSAANSNIYKLSQAGAFLAMGRLSLLQPPPEDAPKNSSALQFLDVVAFNSVQVWNSLSNGSFQLFL